MLAVLLFVLVGSTAALPSQEDANKVFDADLESFRAEADRADRGWTGMLTQVQ